MSAFLAIIKKELYSVIRDRTMVIAIVIQLFIASFSSALLIGMLSLYDPDSIGAYGDLNLTIGLVSQPGQLTADPLPGLLRARGLKITNYSTLGEAQEVFNRGEVDAILSAPMARNGVMEMKLYLPRTEATSSLLLQVLQDPLKRYEVFLRQQRGVEMRYTDLKGQPPTSFEFIYSVLIPVLMFFPAFVAGSMVIDSLSEEVEQNTLQTLLSAPLSIQRVVGAKIMAAILLALLQCVAWLGLLRLNQINVENAGPVLLLAVIIAGLTTTGSAIVAALFKDRERSQFVYSLALLLMVGMSYALDISPIKTMSRLAVGDYYVSMLNVLVFVVILAGFWFFCLRATRKLES